MMRPRGSPNPGACAEAERRVECKEKGDIAGDCVRSERYMEINETREAYELKRVQDGARRVLEFMLAMYPLWFGMVAVRWWIKLDTWQGFAGLQIPPAIVFVCVRWNRERLLHVTGKQKVVGVVFQSAFWIVVTLCISFGSLALKTELLCHRMFLICYVPLFSIFTIVGYVPPGVYVPVFCVYNIIVWLLFHYAIGYMNIPCAAYGIVSSVVTYGVYKHLDYNAWNEFEAIQALDKDRQFLKAMHDTLQGLLSSLFDASCICDHSGAMLSSTPQLRDLLGVHEEGDPGLQMHELAASTVEADRLLHFLGQICQSGSHRAQAIQASLQAAPRASSVQEVEMFGILLPDRADGPTEGRSKRIFIGLLGQGNSVSILDTGHTQPIDLGEVIESARPPDSDTAEVIDFDDLVASNVGSLSYTRGRSSDTGTNLSRVSHRQLSTDAATQTEAICIDQQVPAAAADVSVQTEAATFHHLFECPRCYLPQPARELTREQAFFKDWKPKSRSGKKIVLNSSKRVLPGFVETPDRTIWVILWQALLAINARGRGCCSFHIIVARISQALAEHRTRECNRDFSPFSDWQCQECKAMQEDDEVVEGDLLCCSICGAESGPLPTSGSRSSARADSEADEIGS